MRAAWLGAALLSCTLGAQPALAQDRPNDADIFGAPAAEKPAPSTEKPAAQSTPAEETQQADKAQPAPEAGPGGDARDADLLSDPDGATRFSAEAAPEDPLRIGGMFYLRTLATARGGQTPDEWSLSAPALLDTYLDARPNDRVRGMALGRLSYDSTLPETATETMTNLGGDTSSDPSGASSLNQLFTQRTRAPRAVLDQLWLRFDLGRSVFVTAGKQHVRWGTARFWTPTDYLHIRRRNPLDVFDARTGTTMVKLHMPWESTGWNFYAYGLLEGTDATATVADVAGAARAEIVLDDTELGLGALVQRGRKPKLALDVSTGIWDLDVYGELALRSGDEIDRVGYLDQPELVIQPLPGERWQDLVDRYYPTTLRRGWKAQVVGGVTYARKYNDNDVFNLGAEYFYNPLGYDSPKAYPGLVLPRQVALRDPATFFYLGRHYAALYLNLPAPYDLNYHSFTLSTLGNLSDLSFISRLDYAYTLLTHLSFEAFVAGRFGRKEGEFRFGVSGLKVGNRTFEIPPMNVDLGVGLRVKI